MMPSVVCIIFSLLILINNYSESANILAVFPTPSISHQLVFRPLMLELAKRGHRVTVITTDPAFQKHQSPANLTEIDVHDISYKLWREFVVTADGDEGNQIHRTKIILSLIFSIFEKQFQSFEVQKMINDKKIQFDLLFLEHFIRPALSYAYLYNVPVISFNSFGPMFNTFDSVGDVNHPIVFPQAPLQRFHNLNTWEKVHQFYEYYTTKYVFDSHEEEENDRLKRIFGSQIPDLTELRNNIHMTFLNTHHIWDNNRPVSPNVIYLGGIHQNPVKELPKDLKLFLDQSTNGLIYMSFGNNFMTSLFPTEKIKIFTDIFSILPYNVLLKWDNDLSGCPSNVKSAKWFPQSDLLRHKNVKAFITHGGFQSMSESIDAGVPLIGIPMSSDQWYNMELCIKHEIGVKLDLKTLTGAILKSAIETVIGNESYHENIIKVSNQIHDQPQSPLDRAVWWTEYVLRHGGAKHLRSAAAAMHWTEYYELNVTLMLLFTIMTLTLLLVLTIKYIIRSFFYNKLIKLD